MIYVSVCVPSIGRSGHMLHDLLTQCRRERRVVNIRVYDNSEEGVVPDATRRPGWTIYEEFNEFGREWNQHTHMAFLNDDIVLAPGTLDALANELDGNHDLGLVSVDHDMSKAKVKPKRLRHVSGTIRKGGIASWVFMVKLGCWPARGIDERFKVWYGDDDLLMKIENRGKKIGVLEGVTAEHRHSLTLNSIPGVGELQAADAALWHSLGRS